MIYEPGHAKMCVRAYADSGGHMQTAEGICRQPRAYADSESLDQPVHWHSLIRAFAVLKSRDIRNV